MDNYGAMLMSMLPALGLPHPGLRAGPAGKAQFALHWMLPAMYF